MIVCHYSLQVKLTYFCLSNLLLDGYTFDVLFKKSKTLRSHFGSLNAVTKHFRKKIEGVVTAIQTTKSNGEVDEVEVENVECDERRLRLYSAIGADKEPIVSIINAGGTHVNCKLVYTKLTEDAKAMYGPYDNKVQKKLKFDIKYLKENDHSKIFSRSSHGVASNNVAALAPDFTFLEEVDINDPNIDKPCEY